MFVSSKFKQTTEISELHSIITIILYYIIIVLLLYYIETDKNRFLCVLKNVYLGTVVQNNLYSAYPFL